MDALPVVDMQVGLLKDDPKRVTLANSGSNRARSA
jgi:hypothetical protein